MAEIKIDFAAAKGVSTALDEAVHHSLVPQITALQQKVSALLQTDGGLFLQKTSPALEQAYTNFNSSLLQAINGITSFSTQFTTIATSLENMDIDMAKSMNK